MRVAVLGAGNGGVASAFDFAQHGHEVALYAVYLALAERHRPDVAGEPGDAAEAYFRRIEEAHETLREALRRRAQRDRPRFLARYRGRCVFSPEAAG